MKRLLPNIEMRRIIVTIFALMMVAGGAYAYEPSGNGTGTKEDPYVIKTPEDLMELSKNYANDADLKNKYKYFRLGNDIDMNGVDFIPIGGYSVMEFSGQIFVLSSDVKFKGSLDGDGKKISNLSITNIGTGGRVGLFGSVSCSGEEQIEIKNLTIESVTIEKGYAVGGLVGEASTGFLSITNCHILGGSLKGSVANSSNAALGGLVGYAGNMNLIISECSIENVDLKGSNFPVGGVVGFGGIGLRLERSSFSGNIEIASPSAGGIVGRLKDGFVRNCGARGMISIDDNVNEEGVEYIGGIVGYLEGNKGVVRNCFSSVSISAISGFGGLVGLAKDSTEVKNCYSVGVLSLKEQNGKNYNVNSSVGFLEPSNIGDEIVDVENVYAQDDVLEDEYVSGDGFAGESHSELYMQSGCFAEYMNSKVGEIVWYEDVDGVNNGYPIPAGLKLSVNSGSGGAPSCHPIVRTDGVSSIGSSAAKVHGSFAFFSNPNQPIVDENYGFEVSKKGSEDWIVYGSAERVTKQDTLVSVSGNITGLESDAEYELRAFVIYDGKTYYGKTIEISTLGREPNKDGFYEIWSREDMEWLAERALNGKSAGKYKLMDDIEDSVRTIIGTEDKPFEGFFDGNGHAVTVAINQPDVENVGVFGVVSSDADCIVDLSVRGYVNGSNNVGAICGKLAGSSSVVGCCNAATVKSSGVAGGIVGLLSSEGNVDKVTSCVNIGEIVGSEKTGGIVGSGDENGNIKNCLNSGYVHSVKYAYGIAGGGGAYYCVNAGCVLSDNYSYMVGGNKSGCVYDKQMYYGRTAAGGDPEKTFSEIQSLSLSGWHMEDGYYPVPERVKNNVIAKLAAVPIIFTAAENLISSVSDSILLMNKCSDGNDVTWSYDNEQGAPLFKINSSVYYPTKIGESVFSVSCDGLVKRIPFKVTDFYFSGGLGTKEEPYLIASKEDMEELAKRVNENIKGSSSANWSAGKYFEVTADIDSVTTIIGTEENAFEGVFDGNKYVILLDINSDQDNVGMFGYIDGGDVHSVSVRGTVQGANNVGGLCGYLKSGSLEFVSNSAVIVGKDTVGGICGNSSGSLLGVTNIAEISGENLVGGLCGVSNDSLCVSLNSGIVKGNQFVGGISGKHQNGVIGSILSVGQVLGDSKVDAVSPVGISAYKPIYYDEQLVASDVIYEEGKRSEKTAEMVLSSFQRNLGSVAGVTWQGSGASTKGYPRVGFESDINKLAQMTIVLDEDNDVNNVTRVFSVSMQDGFKWSAENDKVTIDEDGNVSLKGVGKESLIVTKGDFSKRIEINISCLPVKDYVLDLDSCGSVTYKGIKYVKDTTLFDVTITGESFCDTIATVNIKVGKTYDIDTLVAGCKSVVFDGETYDKDTSFVILDKTSETCDSIVNVTINVFKPKFETLKETVCDKYEYECFNKEKILITSDTLFNDTIRKVGLECDSIIRTVDVTIGARDTIINIFGCNEVELGGSVYEKDTILYDSLKTTSGCDSVVVFNIDVYKTKRDTITVLNSCDSAVVRSEAKDRTLYVTKKSLEIFTDTLPSDFLSCDSIIFIYKLGVSGYSTPRDSIDTIYLDGCDTVVFDGEFYTKSRIITHDLKNESGCDSIIPVNITVNKSVFTDSVIHACDSLLYVTKSGEEIWIKESGMYYDRLKGVVPVCGCDSVWNVSVNIHKTLRIDSTLKDCDSVLYVKNDEAMIFYKDTVFMDTIKYGCDHCDCDSIIRKVNVIVSKSTKAKDVETKVLVGCDSLLFESEMIGSVPFMVYSDTLLYDSLLNMAGCDSIVPIEIKINRSSVTDTILLHACDSFVYKTSDGIENIIKRDQELQDNLKNEAGCDSIVLLDIRIHKVKFEEESFRDCDSVVYERLSGEQFVIKKDTLFTDTLKSEVCDCDSLIKTVSVSVSYSTPASEIETVVINECDSFIYKNFDGEELVFKNSAVYMDTMVNASGCDSIVPVQINISASSSVTNKKMFVCGKFEYESATGVQYSLTEDAVIKDTLKNVSGCDSVLVMDVRVVKVEVETPDPIVGCDVVSYTYFSGEERDFVRDTMFYDVLKSKVCECDSIKRVVSVKVNNATQSEMIDTVYIEGCSSVIYKDVEYTESVVLHDSLQNVYGCDSIVPISINVLQASKTRFFEEACVSYRYVNANNEMHVFTKDTVFIDNTFKNSEGCDSVIIIDLKVYPQKYDSLKYVACGELALGDSVYTESTSWKVVPNDPCDPIKVYIVTINPVYEDSVKLEGCSVVEYKEQKFEKDTTFVENNKTILGCDSIVHVNITVHQPSLKTLYKSSCEFVEHEGIVYTESTEVEDSYINEFGCVSPMKVIVEVLPPLYGEDRKVGCGSVWFKDSLYTESTLVVDTLVSNVTGCDSIVDVSIEVYKPVRTIVEIDSCNRLTYKGVVYTETTFLEPDTFETVYGCDSIVEVHLLVRRCFPYPIVVNKYNWILLCNNSLMKKDFEYKAYQWYKDDQIVLGATKSYYTENKELDGCYQVGVTLENDTVLLSEKVCVDAEHKFELYPNPVNKGQSVYIKCGFDKSELEGARVEVFNPLGIRVRNEKARFNEDDEIVVSPMTESGTYYVKITVSADMAFGARFIVK